MAKFPRSLRFSAHSLFLSALLFVGLLAALAPAAFAKPAVGDAKVVLLPALSTYLGGLDASSASIPQERRQKLEKLALFVRSKRAAGETAKLVFICTHNSRRSHLSQLWATVAAAQYGVDRVETFSGGVETTAFNPRAVAALARAGFELHSPGGENPHYQVTYAKNRPALEAFSKKYDDAKNPHQGFAAVMTCSQADKNCPSIEGASMRVSLPYEDPKVADDTAGEVAKYDERSKQIATEMLYLFSRVAAK